MPYFRDYFIFQNENPTLHATLGGGSGGGGDLRDESSSVNCPIC